ncbi:AraC family transcriptional regulator [Paenibacillus lautus]|uniref:AraC family transcriptional regulator n=1 Tax=Paenibacillus lautus TaxID=1401 RepID=UPI002DBB046E|nr:AraC family transcriptional regulator [Paenibacillus lautus]MEC0259605.1 AraC family transcriptional regulator [Paenibacillus lautus]
MSITEPAGEVRRRSSRLFIEMEQLRSRLNRFDLLENYIDNGMKDEFIALFRELFTVEVSLFSDKDGRWFGLELFFRMSAFYLAYMNKRRLFEGLDSSAIQAEKMLSPDEHASWREMIDYFCELGAALADYNGRKQIERTNDMIAKVHDYIHQFLHEELSLTKLAGIVYLSPPYFSRLYKQMTGQGLLEYINETRIYKAKLLLKTTDRKIHQIASEVGLESAPYFSRLFRKRTGFTPQEYRDSCKP